MQAHPNMTNDECHELNQYIRELEQSKETDLLDKIIVSMKDVGETALGSKSSFQLAVFDQIIRDLVKPGESLTKAQKAALANAFGLSEFQFAGVYGTFMSDNPEFAHGSAAGRKRVQPTPMVSLTRALKKSSKKIPNVFATKISNTHNAVTDMVATALKVADKSLSTSDVDKFLAGNRAVKASSNARVRAKGFNGESNKRIRNDTPPKKSSKPRKNDD